MTDLVGYETVDGTAIISVSHPPVNALAQQVRAVLISVFAQADSAEDVQEIVLLGEGATFPAGGGLAELDSPAALAEPHLRDLCTLVENSEKPVVAALHGTVFGGGMELALAAHYRLAQRGTRLGLPG